MKNEKAKLDFANEYVQWKIAKQRVYPEYSPAEFMEEMILREKAEIFDQLYDMCLDGTPDIQEVMALVLNE